MPFSSRKMPLNSNTTPHTPAIYTLDRIGKLAVSHAADTVLTQISTTKLNTSSRTYWASSWTVGSVLHGHSSVTISNLSSRNIKFRVAEQSRFMKQSQQWVPSLAEPRGPTPPRGHHEQRIRCSVDKPRLVYGAVLFSVGRRKMSLLYQKQYCSCKENGNIFAFQRQQAIFSFSWPKGPLIDLILLVSGGNNKLYTSKYCF